MSCFKLWPALLLVLASTLPGRADELECLGAAAGPAPGSLLTSCEAGSGLQCDLGFAAPDALSHRSSDLRLADPFESPDPERPRFFFDTAGNRFYAPLFVRLTNLGGIPAARDQVRLRLDFKATGNWADLGNPAVPWQAVSGSCLLSAPSPEETALFPGEVQVQQLRWKLAPGTQLLRQFLLRVRLSWPADASGPGGPDASADNNDAVGLYDLATGERLAQFALALDLSGSMTLPVPSGSTRLAEAKDKAQMFAALVEDGNQLGAYGFATGNPARTSFTTSYWGPGNVANSNVTLSETSVIAAQRSITGDTDRLEIAGALASQSPHGSTPVGQGLLRARDGLASLPPPDAAAAKAIVLLSDGLQNVAPTVNGTEPTAIDAVQSFSASGVAIYSIFFGDETGWGYSLMEEIKNQTGGDLVIGTSTGLGLAAAYLSIRGLVDDLVYFEPNGETSLAEPWPSFEVPFDQNPGPATVALAWELGDGRTRLTVDLRRKGEPAWQLGSQLSPLAGSSFLVFRFKPGPGSSWEFRVRQTAPQSGTTVPVGRARFAAAVYSAVASAQLRASLADRGFVAGQPLPIEAELGSAGQPVLGATVTARVKAPARPFGTTLRRYAGRFQPAQGPDSAQVSGLAAQLADFLRRDQGSAELYPSRELTLRLHDDGQAPDRLAGDGVYSGLLAAEETRIAGPYEVTVEAQVTDGRGRELRRTARLATLAGVAPADPLQSSVAVALGPPNADGSRRATVTILPTDRFGNAAFPGSNARIEVQASGASLSGPVVDPLDGRFLQELLVAPGAEPKVSVAVGGVTLEASAPEAPKRKRLELSLHLGLARPQGELADRVNAGPTFALDLRRELDASFALRLELGASRFHRPGGGSLDLGNLNLDVEHRWQRDPFTPYFSAGLGYYRLEGGASGAGFAAGVGLLVPLSSRLTFDLNLNRHVAAGLDVDFSQVRAGFLFAF